MRRLTEAEIRHLKRLGTWGKVDRSKQYPEEFRGQNRYFARLRELELWTKLLLAVSGLLAALHALK